MRGKPRDEAMAKQMSRTLDATLSTMCNVFLRSNPFLAGERPTIADLLAYQEIIQLGVVAHPFRTSGKYPQVNAWLDRMEELPHLDSVNGVLRKVCAKAEARAKL